VCKNPARSAKVKKLVRFLSEASSGVTTFLEHKRVHQSYIELKEEAKDEAFETLKIFQGEGKSTCSR
jgi:hypothetical protein